MKYGLHDNHSVTFFNAEICDKKNKRNSQAEIVIFFVKNLTMNRG